MKCEKCGKNEATMYYKETVNGVTREMHLCPECAQKENLGGAFENAFQSMNHFWSDPFHSFLGGGFGSSGGGSGTSHSQEVTTRNLHKKVSFIFNPSRAGLQMQALAHLLVQV